MANNTNKEKKTNNINRIMSTITTIKSNITTKYKRN